MNRVLVVVAAVAALTPASAATAATVSVEEGVLRYVAAPGETNSVDVTYDPGYAQSSGESLWLLEYSTSLTLGAGCAHAPNALATNFEDVPTSWRPGDAAVCTGARRVEIDLGDGADRAYAFVSAPMTVLGGPGDDLVWSGPGDDVLDGGAGDDRLLGDGGADTVLGSEGDDAIDGDQGEPGGPPPAAKHSPDDLTTGGPDIVDGGPGDDLVLGDRGADVIRGGDGRDFVDYGGRRRGVRVTLGGGADDGEAGEGDAVTEVERVRTTPFADVVAGTAADELFQLGAGDDVGDGGAGRDRIDANAGDDRLELRDGVPDTLLCGSGSDSAVVDAVDEVTPECEALARPPGPPRYAARLRIAARRGPGGTLRVTGALLLSRGHFGACAGARVHIKVSGQTRTAVRALPLSTTCRFATRLRIRSHGESLRVSARVPDSERLVATRTSIRLRARR